MSVPMPLVSAGAPPTPALTRNQIDAFRRDGQVTAADAETKAAAE